MKDALIKKYNVSVPRYTSYPPANYFHELSAADYLAAIEQSNDERQPHVSFYVHIPFCFQLCHYCGCNSYPMAKAEITDRYVAALHQEIDLIAAHLHRERRISQIHYGGGSPTSLPLHHIRELNEHLLSLLPTINRPEIAIECHPGYLSTEDWQELTRCGFNRYSLGIQDFDERVLQTVNRAPSRLPVNKIMQILRASGATVNMDFLFGLPYQTPDSFQKTIEQAVEFHPDRIVTFSYGHVPWIHKRQLILERYGLPADSDKQEMFNRASSTLHRAGYRSIGLDHFVLPNDELSLASDAHQLHRNFQGYCTRRTTGQVYAFGVTGISQLSTAYAQNGKEIAAYIDRMSRGQFYITRGYILTRREQIVREVIESMMCNYHLVWSEIAERLSLSTTDIKSAVHYDAARLQEMAEDGIINLSADGISMTSEGSPFVRNVVASLDPLMTNTTKRFSKPI